ncbi:MAG TPA: glycoside hydrolase family 2 TIM barrel-domain containing protein [Bacteroidota bacterium]|nr:glycoside hydrolase family 2 TIM barrel-domain containing protein [Bacteroidota bacterium]
MTQQPKPIPVLRFLFLCYLFLTPLYGFQLKVFELGPSGNKSGEDPLHLTSPLRQKIDLNGPWSYSLDGEQWFDVNIPASFDYEGSIIFQRKFSVERSVLDGSRFKIVALGINHEAEIFINDVFVGRHTGGYTSFQLEIPENTLQFGAENIIKVVVNNALTSSSTIPVRKQIWGWRNYGGIVREMYILVTPTIHISKLGVQTTLQAEPRQGSINLSVVISTGAGVVIDTVDRMGKSPTYGLEFELLDFLSDALIGSSPPQPVTLKENQDIEVRSILTVNNPKLWSPETPELYRLKASIVRIEGRTRTPIDVVQQLVGFRTLELSSDRILLNRKPVTLKGVVWHEDSPENGASLSYAEMERDVVLIKTLGANAIRFAFHPPHPYMLNLCSRYGLLAFVEIPVWNVPAHVIASETFQTLADGLAREMVERDRHHPSIIAWGIGSQFDSSDLRACSYVQRLAGSMRLFDERPIYYGSRMIELEQCGDLADVVALIPDAEDLKAFKLQLADWKKRNPRKPLVVLQYGKPVEHHNRSGYSDPMSQEAQGRFFLQHYDALKQAGAAGSFINAFADWRGDRPILTVNTGEPYIHPLGLVSRAREKRLAFEVVKNLFADQKVAALPVGSYRPSLPVAHVVSGFIIIFVVAYQYNYNRRFREALKRSLLRPYNFFADLRDLRAVAVSHTVLLAVGISMTLAVVLSSLLYHYRHSQFADLLLTQFVVSDLVKEQLIKITWHPVGGIVALTGVFFGLYLVVSVLVKAFSVFVKTRIFWFHAFSVTVWGASPFLFLSPFGMSLFKILENPIYVIPSFILLALFGVWVALRLFRGISVIYDISATRTYVGGVLVSAAILAGIFLYYDSEYAVLAYVEFILNILRATG